MCVVQGYYKEDSFHAPMREARKGTAGAYSRAWHVRVRSPVSHFHAQNSYWYVQHCFHVVSANKSRDHFCAITRKALFSILL